MSMNGKNDVIKGPVLGKPNLFRHDFWAKPYFQSKQLLVLLNLRHLVENTFKMLDLKK